MVAPSNKPYFGRGSLFVVLGTQIGLPYAINIAIQLIVEIRQHNVMQWSFSVRILNFKFQPECNYITLHKEKENKNFLYNLTFQPAEIPYCFGPSHVWNFKNWLLHLSRTHDATSSVNREGYSCDKRSIIWSKKSNRFSNLQNKQSTV